MIGAGEKDIQDYFSEELQDVLDYTKAMKFINMLPEYVEPSFIQMVNNGAIKLRNEVVVKLDGVLKKYKYYSWLYCRYCTCRFIRRK